MIESASDLAAFFDPAEFGAAAVIELPGGPLAIVGNPSTHALRERPGSNTNSSMGSFMLGAADFNLQAVQFMTPWAPIAGAQSECLLTIEAGEYAGVWRVRDIQRDGSVARLILNKP